MLSSECQTEGGEGHLFWYISLHCKGLGYLIKKVNCNKNIVYLMICHLQETSHARKRSLSFSISPGPIFFQKFGWLNQAKMDTVTPC